MAEKAVGGSGYCFCKCGRFFRSFFALKEHANNMRLDGRKGHREDKEMRGANRPPYYGGMLLSPSEQRKYQREIKRGK
jgi:hypothetical protein